MTPLVLVIHYVITATGSQEGMKQNVSYEGNYGSVNSWMTASHAGHSEPSPREDPEMEAAGYVTLFIAAT